MAQRKASDSGPVTRDASAGQMRLLFPTPVVFRQLEGADKLNAALEQRILAQRAEHPGLKLSNRGGWQSAHNFPAWAGAEGDTLIQCARDLASAHVDRADRAAQTWSIEAWANVSGSGAFNMPHVHGGTYWAAVYYVRRGAGEGGQLVLHDPRMPGLRMHAPGLRFTNAGPDIKAMITPEEGLLVMFPGWLSHSVEPWEGTGERISVAMNIRART
jgi:uncharacterized protein (TIGR02466 family)